MLPDRTLLGRYRIVRFIANGGMGEVYLAEDTVIQRNVAIKVIVPQRDPNKLQEALRLFQREMKAITRLDNPHILPLYDFGEANVNAINYAYMVMPYREEGTLETWLKAREKRREPFLSFEDIASILGQAADALQQAHDDPAQILHLDVKPSNFLIRNNREHPHYPDLLLADFGTAKIINATGGVTDTVRGSFAYMPKEQWKRDPKPASDQYALAIMVYELLTYQRPFQGAPENLMYQHLHELPKPPSTLNPRIPPEIDAVILKALAKNYEDRYPTVITFADAFKGAFTTESESERKIAAQLQSLEQEIQALRAKPSADPRLAQQIQQLSKEIAALQKQASNGDQNVVTQLQKLAKDIEAQQGSSNGNQDVLKQLRQLSQYIALITPSNNDQRVIEQLEKISKKIANLQLVQNDNQAFMDKMQEVTTTQNKTQSALNTKVWTCSTFIVYVLLVVLIIVGGFGLYYGSQAYNYFSNIQSTFYSDSAATSIATNVYPSYLPGNETLVQPH